MKLQKFQRKVSEFFKEDPTMGVLFLVEEAGEVAKEFKKDYKDNDNVLNLDAMQEEMGDVLVALAVLANATQVSLDDLAEQALEKWQEKQGE